MHILLGILALVAVALVWYWRVKAAREAGGEVVDAADDIRLAARRTMYKRRHDAHPADGIEDPRLAASGIVVAIATMDGPISQAEIARLKASAQATFDVSEREALDIVSFGRWIAGQCNTNAEAVRRLVRIVVKRAGPEAGPDLVRMIDEVGTADGNDFGDEEMEALDTVRRSFGMG